MSQHDGDYDEMVGRILHAAADLADPADDGLDRIRARLETPYPRPVAWLLTASAEVAGRALSGLLSASARLQAVLAAASERLRAGLGARLAPPPRAGPAGHEHEVVTRLQDMPGWSFRASGGEVLDGAAPLRLPGLLRRSLPASRADRGSPWRGVRWRRLAPAAAAVLVAAVAATPTALSHVLSGRHGPAWPQQGGSAAESEAAAWVAAQVSRSAGVACDPGMCLVLRAHGVASVDQLGPAAAYPRRASVLVVTPAVRSEYGRRVSSAYAPAVLASFGSGSQLVQVRVTAPQGAAAYMSALRADQHGRRGYASDLLFGGQILISGAAKKQFLAGLVDARLMVAISAVAGAQPIQIVDFGDSGPGASPGVPLRSMDMALDDAAAHMGTAAYASALKAVLTGMRQDPPTRILTLRHGPGGLPVLRVEYAAPTPLGILSGNGAA
jgi:hypothetical protein